MYSPPPAVVGAVLALRGRVRLALTGGSMRPLLRAGMVVTVEPLLRPAKPREIVVFERAGRLVAHRVIRETAIGYVTCGDAFPDRPERIAAAEVIGRVVAIHAGPEPGAERIDTGRFAALSLLLARSRSVRIVAKRFRERLRSLLRPVATALAEPPAFRAVFSATIFFEIGDARAGLAAFADVPEDALVASLRRHHLTGAAEAWLARAAEAGEAVSERLRDRLRKIRIASSLQAISVERTAADVARLLAAAAVPTIFLKGSARLARREPGADTHFSCDVDVLVPRDAADRAMATLRAAGYRDRANARRRRYLTRYNHHREALFPPAAGAPVEVHVALVAPNLVTHPLDFEMLREATIEAGGVRVLDDVATAVHLLYHGRSLDNLRDVLLLSRSLRAFDGGERRRFDAIVGAERRDGRRVRAAVALAEVIAGHRDAPDSAYVRWALLREELPFSLRRRSGFVDAWIARHSVPIRGTYALRRYWAVWCANALWTPSVVLGTIALAKRAASSGGFFHEKREPTAHESARG